MGMNYTDLLNAAKGENLGGQALTRSDSVEPVGAPGDPSQLIHGAHGFAGAVQEPSASQNVDAWYGPAHDLNTHAVVVQPNTPTQVASQQQGRKFVEIANWSGNSDTCYVGSRFTVSAPGASNVAPPNCGMPLAPGGSRVYEQQEFDGDVWVITPAGAGAVLVIVSDPAFPGNS